jgi:hypothetical protein
MTDSTSTSLCGLTQSQFDAAKDTTHLTHGWQELLGVILSIPATLSVLGLLSRWFLQPASDATPTKTTAAATTRSGGSWGWWFRITVLHLAAAVVYAQRITGVIAPVEYHEQCPYCQLNVGFSGAGSFMFALYAVYLTYNHDTHQVGIKDMVYTYIVKVCFVAAWAFDLVVRRGWNMVGIGYAGLGLAILAAIFSWGSSSCKTFTFGTSTIGAAILLFFVHYTRPCREYNI